MMSALEIAGLTAGYGELPVVHDFSTALEAGTITTLIGGNGAGKSTLMRAVFGTCRCFGGTIVYRGKAIEKADPWERLALSIGFVPQGRCNFAAMTVAENFKMACYTLPAARHAEATERVLALFPALRTKQTVMAGNLSGGSSRCSRRRW